MSATFVHLNGPACVGKSTLARLLVDEQPLALCIDIDSVRASLGGWIHEPESKGLARAIGADMASGHLRRGFDVVMPQLTVLPNLIDEYAQIAAAAGAGFVEVVVVADLDELVARLPAPTGNHPRDAFSADELRSQMQYAVDNLVPLAAERADACVIDVTGMSVAAALAAVRAAIGPTRRA